jgi:hypothetical protein
VRPHLAGEVGVPGAAQRGYGLVGYLECGGQLAGAGRKKLTELVLGSEQERALRRADAAVWGFLRRRVRDSAS